METVAVILAGNTPEESVLEQLRRRRVDLFYGWSVPVLALIAADGGGDVCLAADLLPDIVTGDFDSISPAALEELRQRTTVRERPEQDSSDLTKALVEAEQLAAKHVTILGYRGGRSDHLISILASMRSNPFPRSVSLLGEREIIHHLRPGDYNFVTPEDKRISLVTFASHGVWINLHGTDYKADNLLLLPGSLGISNRCCHGALAVSVRQNDLFIIFSELEDA